MMVRQCKLTSGTANLTAWLPDRKDLREGVEVTLSNHPEPTKRWKVRSIGSAVREMAGINRAWRVGGIDAPLV
jgi:hypothetical protein